MTDTRRARAIFIECARRVALDAVRASAQGLDFVLDLTDSQLARDGLAMAAARFADDVAPKYMREDEIVSLATACARQAPVENWWRARFRRPV